MAVASSKHTHIRKAYIGTNSDNYVTYSPSYNIVKLSCMNIIDCVYMTSTAYMNVLYILQKYIHHNYLSCSHYKYNDKEDMSMHIYNAFLLMTNGALYTSRPTCTC